MATTFTWSILEMKSYPQSEGKTNMVCSINWMCTATDVDINNNPISDSLDGGCLIPYDPNETWYEYADLTQEIVVNWIWNHGVLKDAIEEVLTNRIASLQNVPQNLPLPW